MRPALPRTAALAAALVLTLAGCSGGGEDSPEAAPTSSATSTTATPAPTATAVPRPEVGACYALTYEEAVAPTTETPAGDCAQTHTAVTYGVGVLDTYVGGHLLAVDSAQVTASVAAACPSGLASYLGADEDALRLSVLRPVWYSPTLEQSDAGADWYRCDVIAVVADQTLGELPATMEGVLATDAGAAWGLCGTDRPGAEGFARVACAADHTWRAVDVVDLGTTYPGAAEAEAAGSEPCQSVAAGLAEDALDYEWGYEWPTPEQWTAGQTYGICWAPA
ncbi:septum formation family protein [Nocardioides alkalitolerans]|uniref:septum formation family protein n=1 Tax=Nocardioides alkalitolerans TaxID=281714 RepID=UPI0003F647BC|nr:septum formation family protein [Nocardioides alkalitolerans]